MRRMLVLVAAALADCGVEPRPAAAPASPSGTLFLAGIDPGTLTTFDVDAGTATTRRVPQLGPGEAPYRVVFTRGRLVVFALGESTSLRRD